jgi:hypothetical protein
VVDPYSIAADIVRLITWIPVMGRECR